MTYVVKVTREGRSWLADVQDLPGAHTYAGNLESLAFNVEEVIRLVDDSVSDGERLDLTWDFEGADPLVREAAVIGDDRAALTVAVRQNEVATSVVLHELTARGYSARDISRLLKMSSGRVSQIRNGSAA